MFELQYIDAAIRVLQLAHDADETRGELEKVAEDYLIKAFKADLALEAVCVAKSGSPKLQNKLLPILDSAACCSEEAEPRESAETAPPVPPPLTPEDLVERLPVSALGLDPSSVKPVGAITKHMIYSGRYSNPSRGGYLAHEWDHDEVLDLNKVEDFAVYLQRELYAVCESTKGRIIDLTRKLFRPGLAYISELTDLPAHVAGDPRLALDAPAVGSPRFDLVDDTKQVTMWAYDPEDASLLELLIRQFADWPIAVELKTHFTGLATPRTPAEALLGEGYEEIAKAQNRKYRAELPEGFFVNDPLLEVPGGASLKEYVSAVALAKSGGLLIAGAEIDQHLRNMLNLPFPQGGVNEIAARHSLPDFVKK